uniref:Uncharacterized protein n=1 Tax=Arundo donax TaxID=35708 RepID=A0A0A9F291_ARUDO
MEGEAAAAVARIRVVRCPKCDKFLPELPVYSVYVCGGCGATLQAKKKNSAQSSHDSDNRDVKYLEILECVPEASETMTAASTADRSETNKMADVQSKSVYSRHDNSQTGPSASNLNSTVRDDGKEAKYRHIRDWENGEMGQSLRVREASPRSPINGIPSNAYCGEGLVDYHLKPRYRYSNRERSDERTLDGPSRVRGLEKDRAEVLRMLDELRDQVQQSRDVTDGPNGSAPANRAADAQSSYGTRDRLSQLRHDAPQLHRNGSHHSPSLNVQSPSIPVYAAPAQQDRRVYAEPIADTRASSYPAGLYPWRNFDNYFFGQHDPDPLLSCHHNGFYHHAACSCLHCCHQEFLPVQGNHLSFSDQRASYLMNSYGAYPVDSPLFGRQRYSTRGTDTTLQQNRMRANISKKPAQNCEPIAGGAPFTICYNCYEVLQLPKKQSWSGKEYKLWCGSCSHAIVVKLDGSRLDVSEFALTTHLSAGQQNSIDNSMETNERTADERSIPAYCFSDGSHASQEKDLHSNLSESENHTLLGTNSDTSQSRDLPSEANVVSHVPSLPHRGHCGFSPSEHSEVGGRSTHSEPEKVILLAESCKQNSIKDVCVANEMQSPDNEFNDPECTEDALNVQQDADHTRVTKAGDSFLTNLIKKSFKINNGRRSGRARVYVNGFPISDRTVRKAEKLAGAICPGDYWYDYCAGFWGVMGRPCFGMIPPYIPEFNYPMTKNCASGNTGVYVNGRELHQKDLDLLVARGLSDSPGRSYIVENSGKVSDEVTGEELYGLGKLAPTVEKMRRGFGMRVPRVIQ